MRKKRLMSIHEMTFGIPMTIVGVADGSDGQVDTLEVEGIDRWPFIVGELALSSKEFFEWSIFAKQRIK